VKILNRVGGTFLLAILAIATVIGFQSPTGRQLWNGMWQAGETVVMYARQQVPRLNGRTDHDASLAIAIAAVGVIVVLALLKKPVSVRAFTVLVIVAAVVAAVLYNPSVAANF
jgi:hypothetical protein